MVLEIIYGEIFLHDSNSDHNNDFSCDVCSRHLIDEENQGQKNT